MQAFITKGCFTDHGGKIEIGDDSWLVDGKGVHLEGMTHYCPKCKVMSKANATERGFMQLNGRNFIVAGDLSSCGSKYIKITDLAVRDRGSLENHSSMKIIPLMNEKLFTDKYMLIDTDTNSVISNMPYKIYREDGSVKEGVTDKNGLIASLKNKNHAEKIKIEIINNIFDLDEFLDEHF